MEKYGKEDKFWFLMGKINIFQWNGQLLWKPPILTQQTFAGLQDVLKTFSRPLARRLEDVLEDEKLLRWRRLEDMSWRRLEDVSEANKIFTGDICI